MTKNPLTTMISHRKKKKPSSQPQIQTVDSSTKENTRNALPMKPTQHVTAITSSSMSSSQQETSMTAQPSIHSTTNYVNIIQGTRSSSQTAPTKHHGFAEEYLAKGASFQPPTPDQKEKKADTHGTNTSMTATMTTSSAPKTKYSITPPPIETDTENTKAEAISAQRARQKNNAPVTQRTRKPLPGICGVIM